MPAIVSNAKGNCVKLDPQKTIFLIDGSSFLYRAYYALRPLHTPQGIPVQAVYSFCRMIKKLIDTFEPKYIALVWDSKGKTTRHTMFEAYKATRQAPPSDLFEQKEFIVQFADMIGMKQVAKQGVEADDIMYSIAKERTQKSDTAVFITADKDMGQAVSDKIVLFDPFKYEIVDKTAVEEKMGFPVEKFPFYFALLGDASDNIPGVHGIGKKGALDLVQEFDSLEDLYANLDKVKKTRTQIALQENKDNAFLSRDLFLLQYEPTNLSKEDLAFDTANWVKARPLFEDLNFKSLLAEIGAAKEVRTKSIEDKIAYWKQFDFKAVTTHEELAALATVLTQKGAFAFDTETNGLQPLQVTLIGMSFCVQEGTSYYVPCGHTNGQAQLDIKDILHVLGPILQNPNIKKYMHHAKYDQLVLSNYGIEIEGLALDTLIASYLTNKDWQRPGLKAMSEYLFNEPMLSFADVVTHNKYKDFSQVPLDLALLYAATDAHQTFKLVQPLQEALAKENMQELYATIEHPLINVLYDMEKEGIAIDVDYLNQLNKAVTKALDVIQTDIESYVPKGQTVNLNSPKQVEQLLFQELQLPPQKKNVKGTGYSTDQEVLTILADMHPVPALLVQYRELFKLKSTYIEALPTYVNPKTKRIHTTFSQTSVATGRLSSSEPNLQNIPVGGGLGFGKKIRTAFKPKTGNIFLSADYSQIELRVLAHLSGDKNLINAFLQGHDIHAETAARLFDVPLQGVTNEQRQVGKRINFSILYGLTPYGLSKDLDISFKDAKHYIEKYFDQYPQVLSWMESIVEFTKQHSYTQTLWHRRRYVPAIYEKNKTLYEEARRVAINTVAQGTAAEVMKLGMINLDQELKKHIPGAALLLQIHDELLISVPQEQATCAEQLTKEVLESVVDWQVPLVVTTRTGYNWHDISK